MTTMPKTRKEVQERIAWSVNSANKKKSNPNKDTYLFVLENDKKNYRNLRNLHFCI